MKKTFHLFVVITVGALACCGPVASSQSKGGSSSKSKSTATRTVKSTKGRKPELTPKEREELKEATEALKVMNTYHKGKFTRIFNSASKEELMTLPDLGEKTADRIIEHRPFETSAHVVLLKGIGVETFKKWIEARK